MLLHSIAPIVSVALVPLASLWLPIVLSAVIVFVVSSILHMVLTYHRSDYQQLPDEDRFLEGLRPGNLKRGPVGFLMIMPSGPPAMPKFLALWFGFCVLVGVFVAYLAGHTVAPGEHYRAVFRVAGTAAFMAYGLGNFVNGIWRGQTWSTVIKEVIDGFIYALFTAGVFGWLWPR